MNFHYKIKYDVTREYIDDNIIKEIFEFYSVESYWTYPSRKSTDHSIVYRDDLVVVIATVPTSPILINDCLNVSSELQIHSIFNS